MTPESHAFTAAACRSAAVLWAAEDNPVHQAFVPTLELWAERAQARALKAERSDQLNLFEEK